MKSMVDSQIFARMRVMQRSLVGCAELTKVPGGSFDPRGAAHIHQEGNNTITGEAFLRQNGGGVVTCAGYDVRLVPNTPYASKRMYVIYGNCNYRWIPSRSATVSSKPDLNVFSKLGKHGLDGCFEGEAFSRG
jgi:hypothetical protein